MSLHTLPDGRLANAVDWYCPNCDWREQTLVAVGDTQPRYHRCAKLGMVMAPILPEGTKAKVERLDRGDYVGTEMVQTDDAGRPVMSVKTTRDDGEDLIVFAPTATGQGD